MAKKNKGVTYQFRAKWEILFSNSQQENSMKGVKGNRRIILQLCCSSWLIKSSWFLPRLRYYSLRLSRIKSRYIFLTDSGNHAS